MSAKKKPRLRSDASGATKRRVRRASPGALPFGYRWRREQAYHFSTTGREVRGAGREPMGYTQG